VFSCKFWCEGKIRDEVAMIYWEVILAEHFTNVLTFMPQSWTFDGHWCCNPCALSAVVPPPVARPLDDDPCSLLKAASLRPVLLRCGVVHHQSLTSVCDLLHLLMQCQNTGRWRGSGQSVESLLTLVSVLRAVVILYIAWYLHFVYYIVLYFFQTQ